MPTIPLPTAVQLRERLLADHCVAVPIALSSAQLQEAANAWMRFLTLPMQLKQSLFVKLELPDRFIEEGYMNRDPSKKQGDDKELFHFSDFARQHFRHAVRDVSEAIDFFSQADIILAAGKRSLRSVFERFEEIVPGSMAKMYPPDGEGPFFHLRCLAYRNIKHGDVLAKPHKDKGVASLAIGESNPRLRVGPNAANLRPVSHEEYQAQFFGGINLPWFAGDEYIATVHDVIQEGDPVSSDIARWSFVLFVDPAEMPRIPEGSSSLVY